MGSQTCTEFEVCISDDCSTDGRQAEVVRFLEDSGLSFVYQRQKRNARYDANLRASIALARGTYCLLMGNDDAFTLAHSLADYRSYLERYKGVGVATCNFIQPQSGTHVRRVKATCRLDGGPATAARVYRNFSAVAGVVLRRDRAQAHATNRWDGGEMYQTYLACRIIAEGNPVLYVDESLVQMGIRIDGESVDSVFRRERLHPCPIVERKITLTSMARIVADAIQPFAACAEWQREVEWIVAQLYLFPYPYWLINYRQIQSWRYALGICLGMRPRNVVEGISLPVSIRARLGFLYLVASLGGLLVPVGIFEAAKRPLFRLAKALS
jgi:glycosyltransferase involved in cell wall biosynthesis